VKRTFVWYSLALLLLGAAWAQSSKGGTEQAVADLEQKWMQSQRANNPDAIAPYIADKAILTSPDTKPLDKAGFLKEQKATKYSSVDYADVKVTVFGDVAIATGVFKGKGTGPDGKSFNVTEYFTDTWVKMAGGKWQCAASHSSSAKM